MRGEGWNCVADVQLKLLGLNLISSGPAEGEILDGGSFDEGTSREQTKKNSTTPDINTTKRNRRRW